MRFIDLSITLEAGLPSDPAMMIPEIDYWDHVILSRLDCGGGR